jgi:hypothetical protein
VATQQTEMLREGLQEAEAMYAIRDGLSALSPPERCDLMELSLAGGLGPRDNLNIMLYFHAGGIGAIPRAPAYEAARTPGTATVRELPRNDGPRVFEVTVTFPTDPFVDGGTGTYRLEVAQDGEAVAGSYAGTLNGWKYQGKLAGAFHRGGYVLANPAAETPLAKRATAAITDVLRAEDAGRGDFLPQVRGLYAAASEVEAAQR